MGAKAVLNDAIRKITMLVCVMVVVGGIFVVIVCSAGWVEWDVNALEVAAIGLSNSEGMIQMTLLLGFGLVELPRTLWRSADLRQTLKRTQAEAAREMRMRDDAKLELRLALVDAYRLDAQITTMLENGTLAELLPGCCLLFVVCCLLFVVCCLLFVVCCLLDGASFLEDFWVAPMSLY